MARVTIEDCLEKIENRFALVVLASKRVRELSKQGVEPLVECKNKKSVTSLREIAAGKVGFEEDVEEVVRSFTEESKYNIQSPYYY
jgi:DNA-directed RNA polymerase subunit omega